MEPSRKNQSLNGVPRVGVFKVRDDPLVNIPKQKYEGDAGYDLQCITDEIIPPGSTAAIQTGLGFKIPKGYYGAVKPRSGLGLAGLSVVLGTIDQNYQGEIKVILANLNRSRPFKITAYDRVAQITFEPVLTGPLKILE